MRNTRLSIWLLAHTCATTVLVAVASAASPAGVCSVTWTADPVPGRVDEVGRWDWSESDCTGVVRTGTCELRGGRGGFCRCDSGGVQLASGDYPDGWNCSTVPASVDTCDCVVVPPVDPWAGWLEALLFLEALEGIEFGFFLTRAGQKL